MNTLDLSKFKTSSPNQGLNLDDFKSQDNQSSQSSLRAIATGTIPRVSPLFPNTEFDNPLGEVGSLAKGGANLATSGAINFVSGIINFLNPAKNAQDFTKAALPLLDKNSDLYSGSPTIVNPDGTISSVHMSVFGFLKDLLNPLNEGSVPSQGFKMLKETFPSVAKLASGDSKGAIAQLNKDPEEALYIALSLKGMAEQADTKRWNSSGLEESVKSSLPEGTSPEEMKAAVNSAKANFMQDGISGKVGAAVDPLFKTASFIPKIALSSIKGAPALASVLTKFAIAQSTGLSQKTIGEIIANPDNFSKEAMLQFTPDNIAKEAFSNINKKIADISETGKEYKEVRNDPNGVIKVEPTYFSDLIEKNTGTTIDESGKITSDGSSNIRESADVQKLQKIYDRYNPLFRSGEMTNAEFLNMRSDLATMAKYEGGIGSSKPLSNLSSIMRGKLNTEYRPQVQGLKELDTTYGSQAEQLKGIKKDYFNKDGTMKDNAISKISNLTNQGRQSILKRLEEVSPGITEKIATTKAVQDIQAASSQKVGAYTRAAIQGGGAIGILINPQIAIPALIATILTTPDVAVQILRGFGKALEVKDAALEKILNEYQQIKDSIKQNPEGGFVKNPFADEEVPKFERFKDLSTKLLEDLKGRDVVSKQYIEQRIISSDLNLKQVEKDLAKSVLDTFKGDSVPVQEFADKVKSELLPLEMKIKSGGGARYENISLPDNLRGNVANYEEHIYNSPIKTNSGDIHYRGQGQEGYFGHTRVEDMAGEKTGSGFVGKNKGRIVTGEENYQQGNVRRIIEVQSDLYQKGNLERESNLSGDDILKRTGELKKLQQYNDPTAHFRMVREEVKQAAIDGKSKLQFPTGETAMKIEGLGTTDHWTLASPTGGFGSKLKPEDLKVGTKIEQNNDVYWIVTDVLGDGKFKAVQKDILERFGKNPDKDIYKSDYINQRKEQFDISGKVDTNNPIYKFYEKDLGRYLRTNYGASIIKDKQGVQWYQIDIKPEMKKAPVNAFGMVKGKDFA